MVYITYDNYIVICCVVKENQPCENLYKVFYCKNLPLNPGHF